MPAGRFIVMLVLVASVALPAAGEGYREIALGMLECPNERDQRLVVLSDPEGVRAVFELAASTVPSERLRGLALLDLLPGPHADAAVRACAEREAGDGPCTWALRTRTSSHPITVAIDEMRSASSARLNCLVHRWRDRVDSSNVGDLEEAAMHVAAQDRDHVAWLLNRIRGDEACAAIARLARAWGDAAGHQIREGRVACGDTAVLDEIMRSFPGRISRVGVCGNAPVEVMPARSPELGQVLRLGLVALPALRDAASSADPERRLYALLAMEALDAPENMAFIRRGLADEDARVRDLVAFMLRSRGDAGDMPALLRLLDDASPAVRLTAATTLAHWGCEDAVPVLMASAEELPEELMRMPLHPPIEPEGSLLMLRLLREAGTGACATEVTVVQEPGDAPEFPWSPHWSLSRIPAPSAWMAWGSDFQGRFDAREAAKKLVHAAPAHELDHVPPVALHVLALQGDASDVELLLARLSLDPHSRELRTALARLERRLGGITPRLLAIVRGDEPTRRRHGALATLGAIDASCVRSLVDELAMSLRPADADLVLEACLYGGLRLTPATCDTARARWAVRRSAE